MCQLPKLCQLSPGHYGVGGNSGGDGGDQGRERESGGERLGTKG